MTEIHVTLLVVGCLVGGVLTSIALALVATKLAIDARVQVQAMKESTHSIQYVPLEPQESESDKALNNAFEKQEDIDFYNQMSDDYIDNNSNTSENVN